MANPNPYSGQPRYSRDVCGLMRRINALEARASLAPAQGVSEAMDFDLMDGRVYVLVRETQTFNGFRIKVHDATTGAPLHDFALPFQMTAGGTLPTAEYREKNAAPRMCCGGGYIYMPGASQQDEDTVGVNGVVTDTVGGCLWRFDRNGGDAQRVTFPKQDWQVGFADIVMRDWWYSHSGVEIDDVEYQATERFKAWAWGEGSGIYVSPKMQMHYVDGLVYGIATRTGGGTLVGSGTQVDGQPGQAPPIDRSSGRQQMCVVQGDLSVAGWSAASVTEYRGDDKERSEHLYRQEYGDFEDYWQRNANVHPDHSAAESTAAHLALQEAYEAQCFSPSITRDGYAPYAPPFDYTRTQQLMEQGRGLSVARTLQHTAIRSHVHYLSAGASCVVDGRIYFDGGGETPATDGAALPAVQFGSVPADGAEVAEFRMLHMNRLTPFQVGANRYSCAWLYAGAGGYLFALEGNNPRVLNRYIWDTGAFVDAWEDLVPNQMRVVDGVLWLSYPAKHDSDLATPVQSKIEARDPSTMAVLLEFYVGDPAGQTEWEAYKRDGTAESLGTPDGGVSVPELEALTEAETDALVAGRFITVMRDALRRIAPFYLAPTGLRWHLEGSDDDENLYLAAMGDRSAYGATGGERLTWTRTATELVLTSHVTVDGPYQSGISTVYNCIKCHVSDANNKPGTGGVWQEFWAVGFAGDTVRVDQIEQWDSGQYYSIHKTFDIDIGEIHECVTLLEGSSIGADPGA